jgi:diguanylate cyclase (GGDEF)-like protein
MEKKKLLEENQEMRQSLKLFDVSRAVASTIDINRLYTISLDALIQMVPGEAGILVFYENEGEELGLKAVRHLDTKVGEEMARVFKARYEKDLKNLENITVISSSEMGEKDRETLKGFSSILVAPLISGKEPLGFLLVLSKVDKSDYTIRDIKNASFIAEHASTAFDNAQRYVEAKEMAYIDSLTNLYNAKYLDLTLDKELKRADRLMMPVTVLFMDLDNFKKINDDNDHLIGSKVLVEVGKILLQSVREVDTVIRYGGDEYVVILLDADFDTGFMVADRIREAVAEFDFIQDEGLKVKITASIGLATYPVHTKNKKELLKMADMAMYRAKDISRNLVYLAPVPGSDTADGGG